MRPKSFYFLVQLRLLIKLLSLLRLHLVLGFLFKLELASWAFLFSEDYDFCAVYFHYYIFRFIVLVLVSCAYFLFLFIVSISRFYFLCLFSFSIFVLYIIFLVHFRFIFLMHYLRWMLTVAIFPSIISLSFIQTFSDARLRSWMLCNLLIFILNLNNKQKVYKSLNLNKLCLSTNNVRILNIIVCTLKTTC